MIVGIHHVALGVPDIEKGVAFYRDTLGFEVVERAEFDRNHPGADYGYVHFALQVDGLAQEYARLVAAGMESVGPPVDFGVSSAIYGRDPFGNVIEFYETRDARSAQLERHH